VGVTAMLLRGSALGFRDLLMMFRGLLVHIFWHRDLLVVIRMRSSMSEAHVQTEPIAQLFLSRNAHFGTSLYDLKTQLSLLSRCCPVSI
jgi:hypothetical protein